MAVITYSSAVFHEARVAGTKDAKWGAVGIRNWRLGNIDRRLFFAFDTYSWPFLNSFRTDVTPRADFCSLGWWWRTTDARGGGCASDCPCEELPSWCNHAVKKIWRMCFWVNVQMIGCKTDIRSKVIKLKVDDRIRTNYLLAWTASGCALATHSRRIGYGN